MVKAYAITTIMRRDEKAKTNANPNGKVTIEASTKQKVSVFDITAEELEKLEALGAARRATKEEVAIAEVQSGESSANAPTNVEKQIAADTAKAPASGAEGDPQGKPKGATKAASKEDEI